MARKVEVVLRVPVYVNGNVFSVRCNDKEISFEVREPGISEDGEYFVRECVELCNVPVEVWKDVFSNLFGKDVEVVDVCLDEER